MSTNFNVASAIENFNREAAEAGSFAIIDKGFEILPEEYHDFWRWLFDDKEFFEHEELSRIGGYAPSQEVQKNKEILYEYVKESAVGAAWELPKLQFYEEVPACSYEDCRKEVAVIVVQKQKEQLAKLYEWSNGFRKFVCSPLSEQFLLTRSRQERKIFLRSMERQILARAMILYSPDARMLVLDRYTDRLKREILEKMQYYANATIFSLTECVAAENKIHQEIEAFWKEEIGTSLEDYMESRREIIEKVRGALGEECFVIPDNLVVKKCEDGLRMTIKTANVDYAGMKHVYDIDWNFSITKYAFLFYKYVLEENGKVCIDIEGKRELPIYHFQSDGKQGDYFLFLYRCMKLEKCYSWIVLSDILKTAVRVFERDLLCRKETTDCLMRKPYKKAFETSGFTKRLSYHERILEALGNSDRLPELMREIYGEKQTDVEINRQFLVNLYHGEFKVDQMCCQMEPIDFWHVNQDVFCGMLFYHNCWDSMIEKIFFYANYLSDLLEGGFFQSDAWADEELLGVKEVLLVVLKTEQQERTFFEEWMMASEHVVEKVRIMWRNVV